MFDKIGSKVFITQDPYFGVIGTILNYLAGSAKPYLIELSDGNTMFCQSNWITFCEGGKIEPAKSEFL